MPVSEVTVVLNDWTRGNNGKKCELPNVSMNASILDLKNLFLQQQGLANLHPDYILLFTGTLLLDDKKLLKDYNKSNRSRLAIDVYDRVDLNLRVKTLQHCGNNGCVCVPLWAFLFRQTIHIKIADHMTVGELKELIAKELNDPGRYTAKNIKLTFNNNMLDDDKQILKDLNMKNDSTVTLLVDCCYWHKPRKAESRQFDDVKRPSSIVKDSVVEEVPEAQESAAPAASGSGRIASYRSQGHGSGTGSKILDDKAQELAAKGSGEMET